jgi:hypothetical protein
MLYPEYSVSLCAFGIARSNSSEEDQDQEDDNHESQSAAAIVAGPVEWTATKPAKTSKQENDQDY